MRASRTFSRRAYIREWGAPRHQPMSLPTSASRNGHFFKHPLRPPSRSPGSAQSRNVSPCGIDNAQQISGTGAELRGGQTPQPCKLCCIAGASPRLFMLVAHSRRMGGAEQPSESSRVGHEQDWPQAGCEEQPVHYEGSAARSEADITSQVSHRHCPCSMAWGVPQEVRE